MTAMPNDVERLPLAVFADFALPSAAFRRQFDRHAHKAGIADRRRFAGGWAHRKQEQYDTRFEARIGTADFLPVGVLRLAVQLGRAVCKIETAGINHVGRVGAWSGTGFLVDDGLLLTNHHVLNSVDVAQAADAIFDYEAGGADGGVKPQSFRLAPDQLFVTSPAVDGLDYTFVAVAGTPGDTFGHIQIYRGAFTTDFMRRANIIQHPDGRPKEVVLQDNLVLPDDHPLFLHYTTDTEGGSSGAPVFDNNWQLKALHHASRENLEQIRPKGRYGPAPQRLNEGVKISAIAADLELRLGKATERNAAMRILRSVRGEDSFTGYFGARGRHVSASKPGLEAMLTAYYAKEQDVDVAFWNVEWFNRKYRERLTDVAGVIADQNIDIWAFSNSWPEATYALVNHMQREFGQQYDWAASEPDVPRRRRTTTVMWNTRTITGGYRDWPFPLADRFRAGCRKSDELDLHAVNGKIFDRYPGLFHFTALTGVAGGAPPFSFFLVPLHLKAKIAGAKRRRMACEMLADAVRAMVDSGADQDWVLGGDFNAVLGSGKLDPLRLDGFAALSARDTAHGAFTYLGARHRSLIDHVFLSPNMAHNDASSDYADFFVVAEDKEYSDFANSISNHRPVVARLSLKMAECQDAEETDSTVAALVSQYRDEPAALLRRIADEFDKQGVDDN